MVDRSNLIRKLYYSDNLPVLREMEDGFIDLIYLDPPFNSNRTYNIIYPDNLGQVTAFEDTWTWTPECDVHLQTMEHLEARSILNALIDAMGKVQLCAYLVNMAVRLIELQRILKPTGSVYLHCDPTASHYLKIVMDAIFGSENFLNEIVWYYRGAGLSIKYYAKRHDILLWYAKSDGKQFFDPDPARQPYAEATVERFQHYIGNVRDGIDYGEQELNPLGKHPDDVISDIQPVAPSAKIRLYPTQKPVPLLERIVATSSNEGDFVLDPFCGCGTTIIACENLLRNWIGIDITYSAVSVIKSRFKNELDVDSWSRSGVQIFGEPTTVKEVETNLINSNSAKARKEFEKFCVTTIGGMPNAKMGADGGIDGRIPLKDKDVAIISVKSGNVDITQIRELKGLLNGKIKIGIFITKIQPTKPMEDFANQSGIFMYSDPLNFKYETVPKIQILTLEEILRGRRPLLP